MFPSSMVSLRKGDVKGIAGISRATVALRQSVVARSADTLGERPGAGTRDLHEVRIRGDLVEHGQEALRFGQEPVVHVRFELAQGIIDAEAVVFHAPLEQDQITLLPGQTLEDLHELVG